MLVINMFDASMKNIRIYGTTEGLKRLKNAAEEKVQYLIKTNSRVQSTKPKIQNLFIYSLLAIGHIREQVASDPEKLPHSQDVC